MLTRALFARNWPQPDLLFHVGDSRTAGCTVRVVPHFICCRLRISSGRALPRLPCTVVQDGRVFAPLNIFHLLLRLPPSFFAMLDVPRDKYGDEFDAVRERTSSVPFQVRCLRSIAQVSNIVRRGVHLVALTCRGDYIQRALKTFRGSPACVKFPCYMGVGNRATFFFGGTLLHNASQQRKLLSATHSSLTHTTLRASSTRPRAPPLMFPTGHMGRPSATTERLLEGVCSRAVLSHCW